MVDSGPWTVGGRMGVWACERVDVLYCTVQYGWMCDCVELWNCGTVDIGYMICGQFVLVSGTFSCWDRLRLAWTGGWDWLLGTAKRFLISYFLLIIQQLRVVR